MIKATWFPRPEALSDLDIVGPGGGIGEEGLYAKLIAPEALEWREKVGVMTPADGSAKASTRLLKSGGWVFKTDTHQQHADRAVLRAQLQRLVGIALNTDLWHPDKFWFLLRADDVWWPVSACPQLTIIRAATETVEKLAWWTKMIEMGFEISKTHHLGLDLNPSNFGFEEQARDRLYYVDDEAYAKHTLFDIAEAIVARLPEDLAITPDEWRVWGRQLSGIARAYCQHSDDWRHFLDGIRDYPLTPALSSARQGLMDGISAPTETLSFASPTDATPAPRFALQKQQLPQTPITCIFGDVHGNLPALNAVLKEAERLGADSYIFLGDAVSYGPFPKECIERIANMPKTVMLRGNHDHTVGTGIPENGSNRLAREMDSWTTQQLNSTEREWLLALPVEYQEDHWLCVHGSPLDQQRFYAYVYEMTYKNNLTYLEEHQLLVCFYGHTHVQFIYRRNVDGMDEKLLPEKIEIAEESGRLLINPGSVGQPRDGDPRAAFALWSRQERRFRFYRIPYPVDATIQAVKKAGLPEDLVYRLEVGR
ncbi:Ser/Thr protein phosphatase family protein [Candidatus Moduliflexus flocculans]|uniref:Ser/Thr protein phosphatase family protein n=1 Tax=Candidatus Moduliflexus flocculans TaxID=1499966 RepID=A0A0S6VZ92_9BACT|nr:Ser/Thr protein phosphatase family protein [Candidatus Moduliflexus flocculans]